MSEKESQIRVLLVDDHDLNRELTSHILTMDGLLVEEATNGAEALEAFRSRQPGYYDAILMDVQMPVMDGYTATSRIRALERVDAAEITIIAMTGHATSDDLRAAAAAGMTDHLIKPVDFAKLNGILMTHLQK